MKLNGNKKQMAQGDVLLEKIDINGKIGEVIKRQKRGHVLADGETTGHQHRIENNVELYDYYDNGLEEKCMLLKVLKDNTILKHEEHDDLVLDKGNYRVNIVREFDPFGEEVRKVQD